MTKYKCGHKTDGVIILEDNIMSMTAYFTWADSVGLNGDKSQCWECFCKDALIQAIMLNNNKKEKNNGKK